MASIVSATVTGLFAGAAPVLSIVNASMTGQNATVNWTTDTGNGMAYVVVSPNASLIPYDNMVQGQLTGGADAVASGALNVTGTGVQPAIDFTGLPIGTHYIHIFHQADGGARSERVVTQALVSSQQSGAHTLALNIVHRSPTQVNPEKILFEAVPAGFAAQKPTGGQIYDPTFTKLYYLWDFDDPGAFDHLENVPANKMDSNVAVGQTAVHVFSGPGAYNVQCTVIEPFSGNTRTETIQVVVGDQDTLFAGTDTIFVDTAGNAGDIPSGAQVVSSASAALNSVRGQQSTPKRVMFAAGQAHTWSSFNTQNQDYPSIFFVGQERSGFSRPTLTGAFSTNWNDTSNNQGPASKALVFSGLEFDTDWNPVTATSANGLPRNMLLVQDGASLSDILFYDTEFEGMASLINYRSNDPDCHITFYNSAYRNHSNFGILAPGSSAGVTVGDFQGVGGVHVIGNHVVHDGNIAVHHSPGSNNLYGFLRFNSKYFHQLYNEVNNRLGWFSNSDTNNNVIASQPFTRYNPASVDGCSFISHGNTIEAGTSAIEAKPVSNNYSPTGNALIDGDRYLLGSSARFPVYWFQAGLTVRNSVAGISSADNQPGLVPQAFVYVDEEAQINATQAQAAPIEVYGNTFYNLRDNANYSTGPAALLPALAIDGPTTSGRRIVEANNVVHQPGIAGGSPDAPIDMTSVGFDPRNGNYFDFNTPEIPGTASLPGDFISGGLLAGSAAIGDMDYSDPALVPYWDMNRIVRPSSGGNRGAFASAA